VRLKAHRIAPSVAQQLVQLRTGGLLAGAPFPRGRELAPGEIEPLAEIPQVLVADQLGALVTALLSRPRVVADAVEADPEV